MDQRLSLITLGACDLSRSRRFYEALGWRTNAAPDDDDGHPWEVAHNPRRTITGDGRTLLGE